MEFLRRLFGGGGRGGDEHAQHLYVRCDRCGRVVHVRIDLRNDLAADYGDTAAEGYTLIKEVMDDRCFRLMRAELHFTSRKAETSRAIDGGTFVDEAAWEEQKAKDEQRSGAGRT
jgi:hypothetical protein